VKGVDMPEKPTAKMIPTITLPPEQVDILKNLDHDIERARREIAALKKIGLGVSELEDQLEWAAGVRDVLLETFADQEITKEE
jgi:hypothetical protein